MAEEIITEPGTDGQLRTVTGLPTKAQIQATGECKIIKYEPNRVHIRAKLKKPGWLVLSDTYYPGWKVYIDGKEGKIYRGNYIMRTVQLDKGEHLVKFVYEPLSFQIGFYVSLATILVLLAYGWKKVYNYSKQHIRHEK